MDQDGSEILSGSDQNVDQDLSLDQVDQLNIALIVRHGIVIFIMVDQMDHDGSGSIWIMMDQLNQVDQMDQDQDGSELERNQNHRLSLMDQLIHLLPKSVYLSL